MKKRILILANNAGGLYDFRNELLLSLLEEYEVHLSLPDANEVPELVQEGCIVHHTELERRGMNPIKDSRLFLAYLKLIRKVRPEAVLTYTIKPNIYGGLCCRILNIPYLVNITGLGSAFEGEGVLKKIVVFLYSRALKSAECIFFQNKTNADLFRELGIRGKKIRLLPGSGVNLKRHHIEDYPSEKEKIQLTFVGRMMREKGMEELLYSIEKIGQEFSHVIFQFVGTYEEDYKEQIEGLAAKGYAQVSGYQKEIHPYYKKSWAVVMPSFHEGMNNVILEASATARPVLASDIPGCREGFTEGMTGFGFPPRDKEALYHTIKKFVLLPYEEKVLMGKNARKKMEEEFNREIVVQAYQEELKALNRQKK